jgi:hypothetical protein
MGTQSEQQRAEEEWEAAEAALKAAQNLPGGAERYQALKHAGQLRYNADKQRREIEQRKDAKSN